MRDPNRIPKFIEKLQRAWEMADDLRFGQLIMNIAQNGEITFHAPQMFYPEDDKWDEWLDNFIERIEQYKKI